MNDATTHELGAVVNKALDEALVLEVADRDAGKRSVDLHPVDEDRLRDQLESGDLLDDLVESDLQAQTRGVVSYLRVTSGRADQEAAHLVADDGVVGLVLDLSLGPLLLGLNLACVTGGSCCCCLGPDKR